MLDDAVPVETARLTEQEAADLAVLRENLGLPAEEIGVLRVPYAEGLISAFVHLPSCGKGCPLHFFGVVIDPSTNRRLDRVPSGQMDDAVWDSIVGPRRLVTVEGDATYYLLAWGGPTFEEEPPSGTLRRIHIYSADRLSPKSHLTVTSLLISFPGRSHIDFQKSRPRSAHPPRLYRDATKRDLATYYLGGPSRLQLAPTVAACVGPRGPKG